MGQPERPSRLRLHEDVLPVHQPRGQSLPGHAGQDVAQRQPGHVLEAAKYVARLRALKTDDHILLLKTNMGAGHGGSSGRYDALRETAFDYAFLLTQLGAE